MAAGVPIALLAGLADDMLWVTGPSWIVAIILLMLADTMLSHRPSAFAVEADLPGVIEVGRDAIARFHLTGRPPFALETMLESDDRLSIAANGPLAFTLQPKRRGTALLHRLHLRWTGPLGLIRRVEARRLDRSIAIVPQISRVREEAMRLFSREAGPGHVAIRDLDEGGAFHALREFQHGDDPKRVSWRQSARHAKLLVRETQAERNRAITIALDTGRLMCEPLADGLPRIDHAINAGLTLAYVGLKLGDRVGLFAFGARPVLASFMVSGPQAFAPLQRLAAGLEYSTDETNFTLGLTELAGQLGARALVVVFTDFADPTGAERMIENIGRLLQRHLVLFVAFRDEELEHIANAQPETEDAITRAVVAGTLLAQRERVLTRLRRLGADVLETEPNGTGVALIRRYLELKRSDRI
jgi:uncharacterized protein (DUF58 family)